MRDRPGFSSYFNWGLTNFFVQIFKRKNVLLHGLILCSCYLLDYFSHFLVSQFIRKRVLQAQEFVSLGKPSQSPELVQQFPSFLLTFSNDLCLAISSDFNRYTKERGLDLVELYGNVELGRTHFFNPIWNRNGASSSPETVSTNRLEVEEAYLQSDLPTRISPCNILQKI